MDIYRIKMLTEEQIEILYNIFMQKSVLNAGVPEWEHTGNAKSSSQIIDTNDKIEFLKLLTSEFFRDNALEKGEIYLLQVDFNVKGHAFKIQMFVGFDGKKIYLQNSKGTSTQYGVYLFKNDVAIYSRREGGGVFKTHILNMDNLIKDYL